MLALACTGGCLAGVRSGWGYYHSDHIPSPYPYQPPVGLTIKLGWWNSTTAFSFSPGGGGSGGGTGFALEDAAARTVGSITAAIFAVSGVVGLAYLTLACLTLSPSFSVYVSPRLLQLVSAGITVTLAIFTIILYAAMAIGMGNKTKDKFEQRLTPRPDWATLLALITAGSWGGVTYLLLSGAMPTEIVLGYAPIPY